MHVLILNLGDVYMFKLTKQFLGKREAILCLLFSMTNEYVNDYVLRTSANSIEGNLMYVIFYYFINIKPKYFDGNTLLMTFAITILFIVRSSCIIGYVPLAICRILEDSRYLGSFIVAGLFITIPLVLATICIDSYLYGFWTIPQWNFVYVNIIDGISNHFGEMEWHYYFRSLTNEFCEND